MPTASGPRKPSQIVAMGGGGFSMEPDNSLLDDYVFSLVQKRHKRVCFLATASGDHEEYIRRFYETMNARGDVLPSHLPLFDRTADLRAQVIEQDVIYVGGGNTANMLAIWRLHGIDQLLKRAWKSGTILTGLSAGMNCWFEACSTDSFGPLAPLHDGLGFLKGAACPHYDGEADRRPSLHRFIREGLPACYAADDGAALHFVGRKLLRCVSSRPNAKVYRVRLCDSVIEETILPTGYLGSMANM